MRRQDKYPETSTFHYHNANPRNRITTDCVARAISTATDIPYNQVVMEMSELQCETGYHAGDATLYDMYLKSKGFKKYRQPRKDDNTKYSGEEFCESISTNTFYNGKRIVANIGGNHVVCIKEHEQSGFKVWDIWDSTDGRIGNFWMKG